MLAVQKKTIWKLKFSSTAKTKKSTKPPPQLQFLNLAGSFSSRACFFSSSSLTDSFAQTFLAHVVVLLLVGFKEGHNSSFHFGARARINFCVTWVVNKTDLHQD